MAKHNAFVGNVKSIKLVEQTIQRIILGNTNPDSDNNGLNLLAELAEYLRSVFGADVCLLYTQPQESGVVATSVTTIVGVGMVTGGATQKNCSLYNRSLLTPLLELVQVQKRQVMDVGETTNLEELGGTQLPPSLQNLESILFFRTSAEGLVLLGRSQGKSSEPRSWTKGQKDLLKSLANLLAIALALGRNGDRHLTQHQTQSPIDISYPYQKLTNQITQAIRDHQEINQILQQAIIATSETLQANAGLVLLLKYKDIAWKRIEAKSLGMIQVTTAAQWAIPGYEQQLFPSQSVFGVTTSPLCCQALQQAPQPLIINENIKESSVLVMFPLMGAAGKSLLGRVLGFLVLEYSPTRQLLPGELELISSVSNQMSYALIQDQTLRQVKAIVDERTAQLQVSLEVQGRLYEKIRHQVDQLRQLNQIKDEFISAISHELRTPLTSMTLAIRMLQEEELTPERQAKYLEVLAQQCQQEILLINDLLALQQLEENSPLISLEMTNIQPILQQLRLTFQQHWTTKSLKLKLEVITENPVTDNVVSLSSIGSGDNIASIESMLLLDKLGLAGKINLLSNTSPKTNTVSLEGITLSINTNESGNTSNKDDIKYIASPGDRREELDWESLSLLPDLYISTHADTLQRILAELLTNAGKYSYPDTTVVLRVEKTTEEISFRVTNEGEGIPPEEQELIFEKFHRAQTALQKAIPGTGLGLALVKPLVKHLRGKINVVSSPNPPTARDNSTIDRPQGWITCFTVKLPQFLDGGKV